MSDDIVIATLVEARRKLNVKLAEADESIADWKEEITPLPSEIAAPAERTERATLSA